MTTNEREAAIGLSNSSNQIFGVYLSDYCYKTIPASTVVLDPTCFSNPWTGAQLNRTTSSCPSISAPNSCRSSDPLLKTMAQLPLPAAEVKCKSTVIVSLG